MKRKSSSEMLSSVASMRRRPMSSTQGGSGSIGGPCRSFSFYSQTQSLPHFTQHSQIASSQGHSLAIGSVDGNTSASLSTRSATGMRVGMQGNSQTQKVFLELADALQRQRRVGEEEHEAC